jgi:hypothetical protein
MQAQIVPEEGIRKLEIPECKDCQAEHQLNKTVIILCEMVGVLYFPNIYIEYDMVYHEYNPIDTQKNFTCVAF